MATGTAGSGATTRRDRWLGWFDGSLASLCQGSLAVIVAGGLVQMSHGAYSMTYVEAWKAVFDPNVVFSLRAWGAFIWGVEMPEISTASLIVWNIRLPRVFVGMLVGMNLAVSGAIFQAVTRDELASPFILEAEVDQTARGPRIEPLRPRHSGDDETRSETPVARSDGGGG